MNNISTYFKDKVGGRGGGHALPSLTNKPVGNTEGGLLPKMHPLYTPLYLMIIGAEHLMFFCVKVLSCSWFTIYCYRVSLSYITFQTKVWRNERVYFLPVTYIARL